MAAVPLRYTVRSILGRLGASALTILSIGANAGFAFAILECDAQLYVTRAGASMTNRQVCERGLTRLSSQVTDNSTSENLTSIVLKNPSTTTAVSWRLAIVPGDPPL